MTGSTRVSRVGKGRPRRCELPFLRVLISPMSKAEKLATKILSGKSDKNFDFDDLCYVLVRAGF